MQHAGPPQQFGQHPPPPPQSFQQPPPPFHAPPAPPSSQSGEVDPFLQHVVSASLVDMLGKQILVLLRDGRKIIGELLSEHTYG